MADSDDIPEHATEQEVLFVGCGGAVPHDSSMARLTPSCRATRPARPRRRMNTHGSPKPVDGKVWVYVMEGESGAAKIGVAGDPKRRATSLRASLRTAWPVVPEAARAVESEALTLLGHGPRDGEWTTAPVADVIAAVWRARFLVAKRMHVDPELSAEDARLLRISLARGAELG